MTLLGLDVGSSSVIAGVLNLWGLALNGWANDYYSAAVRSMAKSWHNFLFVSFDPSGLMTVDKPPLALWVQALSVRVFGYHPLSVLIPQALMGVAATALMYDLVRRRFGRLAGFVAGFALATTPIIVAGSISLLPVARSPLRGWRRGAWRMQGAAGRSAGRARARRPVARRR